VARPFHGLTPGDGAPAAYSRRGDAASTKRRTRARVRHPSDDDWSVLPPIAVDPNRAPGGSSNEDPDNARIRREPTLPEHEAIAPESLTAADPFAILVDEADDGLRAK
jgi:hypothetical protein